MGKRKERRLAAQSNAGRRVKLDLFAEPSEDSGGSSVHEEVDGEPKHRPGLPNSPSSSGQQPPNPLLLLGQYSDDELDDESDKRLEHGTLDGSISDHDDQAKGPLSETSKDTEVGAGEVLDTLKVSQQNMEKDSTPNAIQNLVGVDNREGDINVASESVKNDSTEHISVVGTSEVQVIGDVGSGWQIVMHEESNQYYYWNIETGETSWEVPNVLHQINQSTSDQKAPTVENIETAQVGGHDLKSTLSAQSVGGKLILQNKVYDNESDLDEQGGGCKNEALKDKNWISDGNGSEFQSSSSDAVDTRLAGGTLDGSGNYTDDVFANDEKNTEIAARTKKRTVAVTSSLRSNKKVSSLVDKWKAVKEEFHENAEDEPENTYEILEKKRQREIEEWHAQQLASGEAKDNANFQPLVSDWREKVKRRRAQKGKESTETPSEVLPDRNQQPDLDKLSRDLPSGWQAYWDEASKQVYYGNVNTLETTWIRPTK